MKKHEEGITLIQTVVAVVMLLIIASFAVLNSEDTVVETKIAKTYNEIIEVKKAVIEIEMLEEDGLGIFSGDRLTSLSGYPELQKYEKENQEYYYLDFKNKKAELYDALDIRNVDKNYIVNVKDIDNIEVFLVTAEEVGGQKLYTDDEIIEKYNNLFSGR